MKLAPGSDTPDHVKEIQLQIWLSKTPYERLKTFMDDNEAMLKAFDKFKVDREKKDKEQGI